MLVYHGSNSYLEVPDHRHSRDHLDFGKGFYVTSYKDQAKKWAARFKYKGHPSVVNVFECDEEQMNQFKV